MTFVFDSSSLIVLKNYYPGTFRSLWSEFDALAADGTVFSVREVLNELEQFGTSDFVKEWAKRNRRFFRSPVGPELLQVQRILAIPHFQTLIGGRAMLRGTPVADPFVVAAAMVNDATVVTEEALKPNAAKIPNVCEHFSVPCINLQQFMAGRSWQF